MADLGKSVANVLPSNIGSRYILINEKLKKKRIIFLRVFSRREESGNGLPDEECSWQESCVTIERYLGERPLSQSTLISVWSWNVPQLGTDSISLSFPFFLRIFLPFFIASRLFFFQRILAKSSLFRDYEIFSPVHSLHVQPIHYFVSGPFVSR